MKQNQGKTLYYEMRMPRKLLFQVSYFSHCVYMFDTDSSEGNLQNTYCIKMFENFFMCYSIFRIILFHIFRNAQHWSFCGLKDFWEFSLIWCAKSFLYYQEYLNHSIKFHILRLTFVSYLYSWLYQIVLEFTFGSCKTFSFENN